MAKYKGSDFRIKVRTATGPDVFAVIGGGKTDSLSISNETVDVTDKDSSGARQLLEGAGVRAWAGLWAISSCERSGEYNKEENFSMSLESAGTITYTAAP